VQNGPFSQLSCTGAVPDQHNTTVQNMQRSNRTESATGTYPDLIPRLPRKNHRKGPGDTWQLPHMCSVSSLDFG